MRKPAVLHLERDPLAGIPCLPSRVAIYIPTTIAGNKASDQVIRFQRENVAQSFSGWFGGYTEIAGNGGWYSVERDQLIREPVFIVYSNTEPALLKRVLPHVVDLARRIAGILEQECVTLEIDGKIYFVPPVKVAVVPV